ncbi:WecB/TagA/CpsF family glycosyltransferase [Amphritea sp. 1_MG-2023]|uniref:WecB/TagA/CpsF family glycosyltransferase n=1 Tax=Amphritea sp. 1_MG-2023 TaxID=3062670 RepID=UPI0026E25AD3|nr:WecB/TagA/CpsF family glycosyltransferase [Amphritea sp. 1_MG-2023]MDO6563771.1 WecB/TagA/CpsF family glycosyltransferase [Amphritea sp. 1_MG-2023]
MHTFKPQNVPEASALPTSLTTSSLLEICFANISLAEALDSVRRIVLGEVQNDLFFVNAHCLNTSFDDPRYHQALQSARLIFPDGSGIRKGCDLNNDTLVENLNGTDLFPHLCRLFADTQQPIFLLGASPGTVERVAEWAQRHAPGLIVAGSQHGFFDPKETPAVIDKINRSGARVLFVAMGVPRQELWIAEHRDQLNSVLNIAVGGLFDFYGGNIPRAPAWIRSRGLEWVWRLLQEPKRMWRRYVIGNPLFILRLLKAKRAQQFLTSFPLLLANQQQRLKCRAAWQRFRWRWQHRGSFIAKRLIDLTLASSALLVLLPLFPLIAIAIRLDSPGPVFFSQTRAGYRNRAFRLWKFRSMHADAEARRAELEALNEMQGGVLFKIKDDPRITRVGRILRKLSLDELPQLWNVLKGDMSIVGPRPALHSEVEKYSSEQRKRLEIRPGLTSDWVIQGRSLIPFQQQAEMDINYAHKRSLWRDLRLIIKTIPALISGKGAS